LFFLNDSNHIQTITAAAGGAAAAASKAKRY
jgi:hypothetical protein